MGRGRPGEDGDPLIVRCHELIESRLDAEMVGLHIDNGLFYGFNPTASRVWELIEQPRPLSYLCNALTAEFDVDAVTCEADLRLLLADMAKDGLITIS